MHVSIPILVGKANGNYLARPLLFRSPYQENASARLAVSQLEWELSALLNSLVIRQKWDELDFCLRDPVARMFTHRETVSITQLFLNVQIPMITWTENGVEFLMAPFLPNFWFIVPSSTTSEEYAPNAIVQWIRQVKKEYSPDDIKTLFEQQKDLTQLRIHTVVLSLPDMFIPHVEGLPSADKLYEFGRNELSRCGRYYRYEPGKQEQEQPAVILEAEKRLYDMLTCSDRKGILVLGPSFSGRTRLIEKVLSQITRDKNYELEAGQWLRKQCVTPPIGWSLSPGRMIAGMSQAGQWEQRCRGIFAYAAHDDLILHFEQFCGFLETGHHSKGSLSVTDILRSELVQRRFRAVAEVTPEELRILQERNRSLVRQFEILEMPTLTRTEVQEIVIRSLQYAVSQNDNIPIDYQMLPSMFSMLDYYEEEKALPGRYCRRLPVLVSQCALFNRQVTLKSLCRRYQALTGFDISFFHSEPAPIPRDANHRKIPPRQRIREELQSGIVGQTKAIEILTDQVLRIRMHMTDLSRTAGAWLFIGPTGVGKTESAKQLANVLYGSQAGLLRFDCNELSTSAAVDTLIGHGTRQGTLTSAVRLRPNCVLLFDEIEKSHPNLADLLLQVLGEGRLTDGAGQIVSFSQCVVIFTSNLGIRDAERHSGFKSDTSQNDTTYLKAVQDFFRPEWLNRLDGIVPFTSLSHEELVEIARKAIESTKKREGFRKRKTLLTFSPAVLDYLADRFGDLRWGARGVLRMLEKELIVPAAEFLAVNNPRNASVIDVDVHHEKLRFTAWPVQRAGKGEGLLNQLIDYCEQHPEKATEILREITKEAFTFITECQQRLDEVFPKDEHGLGENSRRRYLFQEEYRAFLETKERLMDGSAPSLTRQSTGNDVSCRNSTTEEAHLHRRTSYRLSLRQQEALTRINAMPHKGWNCEPSRPEYKRIKLSGSEWDHLLLATYGQTAAMIAVSHGEQQNISPSLAEIFAFLKDYFLLFGDVAPSYEGCVLISRTVHDGSTPSQISSFDWQGENNDDSQFGTYQFMEYQHCLTDDGLYFQSVVGTDAIIHVSRKSGSRITFTDDQPTSITLEAVIPFDPMKETAQDVVQRWQADENKKWEPIRFGSWPTGYDFEEWPFPDNRIPERFRSLIKRCLNGMEETHENI